MCDICDEYNRRIDSVPDDPSLIDFMSRADGDVMLVIKPGFLEAMTFDDGNFRMVIPVAILKSLAVDAMRVNILHMLMSEENPTASGLTSLAEMLGMSDDIPAGTADKLPGMYL